MKRCVVLGNGNLAQSLIKEIKSRGECEIHHFHKGNGFHYPHGEYLDVHNFGMCNKQEWIVWNTIGAGSIPEADKNFNPSMVAHLGLVAEMDQRLTKNATIINFSSDYASSPRLSRYAFTKSIMEEYITDFADDNMYCVRVANLYGSHRPGNTLPYKLLKNKDKITSLPENIIHPTPTEWLAKKLLDINWEDQYKIFNLMPNGRVTVKQFGEYLLDKQLESSGIDELRPSDYRPSENYGDHIMHCWDNSELKELLETS